MNTFITTKYMHDLKSNIQRNNCNDITEYEADGIDATCSCTVDGAHDEVEPVVGCERVGNGCGQHQHGSDAE